MKTKILEANVILKNKHLALLNTSMDIELDWDVSLIKQENKFGLAFTCNSVYGKFSYEEEHKNYSKESIYTFNADNLNADNPKWEVDFYIEDDSKFEFVIQPESIIINFDTEVIKIFL